ncbi:actin cortical patch component Lsb4 [Schizosaccharomyces japonicus yFS275]|uniref:Actin cortical patch component Lsb4 n=1 Tax=Schizosaccharomyces japonicus (strain yFS275 / FY16936) TaxID=402676 RepID=B6JX43_SCHJY|nr:actin cortical patch component Lsb4 [Schizosaccharomyces japonicus yFS275]EEB05944.1 actin cortical patch component Lsb4 [Schizosaccharomyces japonicus yFS275]
MGLHNPLPSSLKSECKKAGKILASFVDPRQTFGPQEVIPPSVLSRAKGLVVMTVLKAGFMFSGRIGSGLIVARLDDGTWSAPSAVCTAGMGFGAQIGSELTDFVIILNSKQAVQTFARVGSITLGGNLSVAAGPLGRNAEAGGSASAGGVAPIFSYSKTKGLFAGVSLEGSVLIERRDANKRLYRGDVTAKSLLNGQVPQPAAADPLYRVLNSRVFNRDSIIGDDIYNDIPVYDDTGSDDLWDSRPNNGSRTSQRQSHYTRDELDDYDNRNTGRSDLTYSRRNRYDNDVDEDYGFDGPSAKSRTFGDSATDSLKGNKSSIGRSKSMFQSNYRDAPDEGSSDEDDAYEGRYAAHRSNSVRVSARPARPSAPKPTFDTKPLGPNQVRAVFPFSGEQAGDLTFQKGDIIDVVQRTESTDDWWTGRIGTRQGIFPANYVKFD